MKLDIEKERAIDYRKHRDSKSIQFADNIKRRLSSLIKDTIDPKSVINMPLYLLKPEFKPKSLKLDKGIDQYVFWDNGEIVITDYTVIISSKSVALERINEIWYGNADEKGIFSVRFMLKNNQGIVNAECKCDSSISVITLLNLAIEPYREIDYITEFDSELADIYVQLRNSEEIQSIDNAEDKAKKKILENNFKKKRKAEAEQYSEKNRMKEELEVSASIRRRFQLLLNIGTDKEDIHIINKYVYELEAENRIIPRLVKESRVKSDEFIFYSNDIYAITDYTLFVEGRNRDRLSIKLQDINQIYITNANGEIVIVLKANSEIRKQKRIDKEIIGIARTSHDYEYWNDKILYFLNIVLEPYRDIDYIPEVKERVVCPYDFLRKFEEERGDFGDFVRNKLDDSFDKEKKKLISMKAKERIAIRKRIADTYRQEHFNPVIDKFAIDFMKLFSYLYELEEDMRDTAKEIKYLNEFRNHYDYEIYECVPEESRKYLDQMEEKGQCVLWAEYDVVLTDRNICIQGHTFSLYDIKEVLMGRTVQADEADSYEDWIDSALRFLVEFKNGTIQNLRFKGTMLSGTEKVWHPLNYTLKMLNNCDSTYVFLEDEFFFCECCNSFNITVSEGLLGKKYRCINCGNKSKKKIIIGYNDENRIDKDIVAEFILQNDIDLKYENSINVKKSSITVCKYCGKQISENIKFCNFCGQSVKANLVEQEKKFCVYCGKEILREAKFCNFCGKLNSAN